MASDALKDVFQVCYPHNDLKQELLLGLQMLMVNNIGCTVLMKKKITQQL